MKKFSARRKKRSRNLSPVVVQNIREVSDILGGMIPATSQFGKGLSFTSISKEYGLNKFLPKTGNKKDRISGFIKNLIQRNKIRTLKKIVSDKLPEAIEKRYRNGNPILFQEANTLSIKLKLLGVNLVKEINDLNLPTDRPKIIPPTQNVKDAFKSLSIHPLLIPECEKLFNDGNLNESVRKSLEKLETFVKSKTKLTSIGTDVMASAFNPEMPKIKLQSIDWDDKRQRGLQDGFKFLNMGLMGYWKNYLSHGDEQQITHQDAISIIGMVSSVLYVIESNTKTNENND